MRKGAVWVSEWRGGGVTLFSTYFTVCFLYLLTSKWDFCHPRPPPILRPWRLGQQGGKGGFIQWVNPGSDCSCRRLIEKKLLKSRTPFSNFIFNSLIAKFSLHFFAISFLLVCDFIQFWLKINVSTWLDYLAASVMDCYGCVYVIICPEKGGQV